jgi:hypothetical protein
VADTVGIRLEGGPCDGRDATVKRTGDLLPGFTCRKVDYQPTARVTAGGRVVYTTKASQKPPPPAPSSSSAKPLKAHGAWHGMLVAVFVTVPKELGRSADARKAIRRLTARRGLR